MLGLPRWFRWKEFTCNVGDLASIPGLGRSPGGVHCNPLQYSHLENPHGQRSLAGYSPWGHKELDITEWLSSSRGSMLSSLGLYFVISVRLLGPSSEVFLFFSFFLLDILLFHSRIITLFFLIIFFLCCNFQTGLSHVSLCWLSYFLDNQLYIPMYLFVEYFDFYLWHCCCAVAQLCWLLDIEWWIFYFIYF